MIFLKQHTRVADLLACTFRICLPKAARHSDMLVHTRLGSTSGVSSRRDGQDVRQCRLRVSVNVGLQKVPSNLLLC
jgi:hypothetical protein